MYFSKGNLQLVGENTWQFAEHQYDYFGVNQSDNHRDLFGWGTGSNPNQTSTNNSDYATFTDWGTNMGAGWRTLTADEWTYLFTGRTSVTTRYCKATVNGVGGVVLFPDTYTHPAGVTAPQNINPPATSTADGGTSFAANVWSLADWEKMEAAGCVLLPAAGWRNGATTEQLGVAGYYWSSSIDGSDATKAQDVVYNTDGRMWIHTSHVCQNGFSVRLVYDPNEPIEVSLNTDKTEAKFAMPGSDVSVEYELKRDLQDKTSPVTFDGIPDDGPIVVKKGTDGKYQPVTAPDIQLIDKQAAEDAQNIIQADGLTVTVEKKGDDGTWTAITGTLDDFLADMQPGTYRINAAPKDETSPYNGTVTSAEFTVVEKYDLTLKAGNEFSQDKIAAVTIDKQVVTPDTEGKVTNVAPAAKVALTAKDGYLISSVKLGDATTDATSVTFNDDKTEATFAMPGSDVSVEYELKRDMEGETSPVTFDGIPDDGPIVVKKGTDGKYQPVTAPDIQLIDKQAAEDAQNIIQADGLTVTVEKKGDDGTWTAITGTLDDFLADMQPGTYRINAAPKDETSPYNGTVTSDEFTVVMGYDVNVPAGEYITYYKEENLYVEDADAALYTVTSVTDTEAVLSDKLNIAPAETPLLVYNSGSEAKTFTLIATTKSADVVSAAGEFKGTLTATTIPASTTSQDNYALNGKAFVWVKKALSVAANKCWLEIGNQTAASRANTRAITGGNGTTGLDSAPTVSEDEGDYYDLQGRKVEKPNRKGIYIKNGKKTVTK